MMMLSELMKIALHEKEPILLDQRSSVLISGEVWFSLNSRPLV